MAVAYIMLRSVLKTRIAKRYSKALETTVTTYTIYSHQAAINMLLQNRIKAADSTARPSFAQLFGECRNSCIIQCPLEIMGQMQKLSSSSK